MMIIFHVLDWSKCKNSIGGIMVRVLVSRAIDYVFEPRSGQTKDYKICMCCFWLAPNNMSEWGDMSIRRLWFQRASTIKIQACWSST